MLTLKYKPKKLKDVIGNPKAKDIIKKWADEWASGKRQKPLLLYGPPGVGKTSIAYALANDMEWSVVELNTGNKRNKNSIESVIGEGATMSLFGGYRLILVDDVDQLSGKDDRGAMNAITNIIKNANNPIILTALNYWDQKITPLRSLVQPVEFRKVNSKTIAKHLIKIAEHENIKISEHKIEEIVDNVNGDVRAALNDLEGMTTESRDTQVRVFDVIRTIFKKMDYKKIREAVFNSDVNYDMLLLWILENIPNEYEKPGDISKAYHYLSRADVFRGRIIRQQYWGYLRYVTDLMSCGVAFAKDEPYHKFTKYKFPHYLSLMSKTRATRLHIKSICSKIGEEVHDSAKDIMQYLWLFSTMAKKGMANDLINRYNLDDKDIEFLKKYKG